VANTIASDSVAKLRTAVFMEMVSRYGA